MSVKNGYIGEMTAQKIYFKFDFFLQFSAEEKCNEK